MADGTNQSARIDGIEVVAEVQAPAIAARHYGPKAETLVVLPLSDILGGVAALQNIGGNCQVNPLHRFAVGLKTIMLPLARINSHKRVIGKSSFDIKVQAQGIIRTRPNPQNSGVLM